MEKLSTQRNESIMAKVLSNDQKAVPKRRLSSKVTALIVGNLNIVQSIVEANVSIVVKQDIV